MSSIRSLPDRVVSSCEAILFSRHGIRFPLVLAWGFAGLVPLRVLFTYLNPNFSGVMGWITFALLHGLSLIMCWSILDPREGIPIRNPLWASLWFLTLAILDVVALLGFGLAGLVMHALWAGIELVLYSLALIWAMGQSEQMELRQFLESNS